MAMGSNGAVLVLVEDGDVGGELREPHSEAASERSANGYNMVMRSERTVGGRPSASVHNIELSGYSLDESQAPPAVALRPLAPSQRSPCIHPTVLCPSPKHPLNSKSSHCRAVATCSRPLALSRRVPPTSPSARFA
jgi:hypothetical protein